LPVGSSPGSKKTLGFFRFAKIEDLVLAGIPQDVLGIPPLTDLFGREEP
jgi:hypothetical protein